MLFHIEQSHEPTDCPYGKGGSPSLHDATVQGVTVHGVWGAFTEHVVFMLVESDDLEQIHRFLLPGMTTCTASITPVSARPIPHPA
jgi:hypothetical protein